MVYFNLKKENIPQLWKPFNVHRICKPNCARYLDAVVSGGFASRLYIFTLFSTKYYHFYKQNWTTLLTLFVLCSSVSLLVVRKHSIKGNGNYLVVFLVAKLLYNYLCPSVRPSVRPSVCLSVYPSVKFRGKCDFLSL